MESYYTITRRDVGKNSIRAFGRVWFLSDYIAMADFLGRVLTRDVGKRVYRRGDILQLGSAAAKASRLRRQVNPLPIGKWFKARIQKLRGGRFKVKIPATKGLKLPYHMTPKGRS